MRIHEKLKQLKDEAKKECLAGRELSIFITEVEKLELWARYRLEGDE